MIFISDASLAFDWATVLVWHAASRALMVCVFVYVAEVASPKWRAFFISLYFLIYQVAYLLGDAFAGQPKIANFVCMATTTASLVLSFLVPESPYWLTLAGDRAAGQHSFQYLRPGAADAAEGRELLARADAGLAEKQRGLAANACSSRFCWRLMIISSLYLADNNVKFILNPGILSAIAAASDGPPESRQADFWRHFSSYDLMINVFPVLGCLVYAVICFFFSRRMLYIVPIIMTFSLYLSYYTTTLDGRIALYSVSFSYLFKYIGGDQIPRIMAAEVSTNPR